MVFVLGCNCGFGNFGQTETPTNQPTKPSSGPNDNRSVTDKAIEQIADGETTGVQECDDLMKFINQQSQSPDDNWVTKGIKDYIFGQFKKSLKESIEQNKNDKVKMAEQCKDLKTKLEKRLEEEKEKQK